MVLPFSPTVPVHPVDVYKRQCKFSVNPSELEGRVCYGGLDLSSTTDITAFVLVFPPTDEDDKYYILPYFWLPEETLDLRVRRDHVPYDVWEQQGYIMTTEGNVVHCLLYTSLFLMWLPIWCECVLP